MGVVTNVAMNSMPDVKTRKNGYLNYETFETRFGLMSYPQYSLLVYRSHREFSRSTQDIIW